ncbi:MAG TPA: uracil phosphoribosyltransferase [Candidatus Faecicola pullistercoris]|nr:uracil phosphoribosyltransferase [Candidatus Faecicola pullistercoris]
MSKVTIFNHPLITHKIAIMRDVKTGSKEFRELVEEVAMLMGYEALRDIETVPVEVQTPMAKTTTQMIAKDLAIVPILRAGLGMVNGILALMPTAKVGHIGLYRDHDTLEPKEYYCKLPEDIAEREVILLDPMLATGGSAAAAITLLKRKGCKNIKLMCILGVQEGIDKVITAHPDVSVYVGLKDEKLNEIGYIVPGLGDAGDRIFGTK